MAPRSAKTKKAADVKVAENEAPKKVRGKAKVIDDEQEVPELDIDEKDAPVAEKKKRGGKKANGTNGQEETNGIAEETAPPTKRGRKKAVEEPAPEEKSNDANSAEESNPAEDELNDDVLEINGDIEEVEVAPAAKGRKKATKVEKAEPKSKQTGRGRKAKPESVEEEKEVSEEKPKAKGRGRKAQAKAEPEPESEEKTESIEDERVEEEKPATKGRKKGPAKPVKEKTPESDKEGSVDDPLEEKPAEEPKKKETKGRKGQAKKAQAKEEVEDNEEEVKEEPASKKRKVNKKEEKGKGDKDEDVEEEAPEAKPSKGKRGQKKTADTPEPEEPQDTGEPTSKRRRKPAEEKASAEDSKQKAPAKNKATTNYEDIDFSNSSKNSQGKEWNFKIASWNVDGIRAWMSKGGLDYIKYEKPDILCIQEIKCAQDKLPEELANLPGYHAYWLCSHKDGYAGVGIYTTKLAMSVQYGLQNEELDGDGRIITAEYEHFYLICTYVPNAGRKLVTLPKRLQWNEEFRKYVKELDKKKPVIICGDMNVAHNEIDLANPKTNKRNAGFTEEERSGMTELLGEGFVDTFRNINPDKTGAYTFWTYMMNSRAKNVGWRLDYFIVSERLLAAVCDNVIRSEVYGSDHCPISLFLHLSTADKPKE